MWEAVPIMPEPSTPEAGVEAAPDVLPGTDTSAVTDVPKPPPPVLRGVARVVDLLVQVAILEVAFLALPYLPVQGLVSIDSEVLGYVDLAVGLGSFWLYCTVSEALGGATLGKAVTALRTVDADHGGSISWRASAVRNLVFFLDALLFGMVAYSQMARSPRRQRGGDSAAGTVVVWAWHGEGRSSLRGWPVGAVAAFLLVWLSYIVTG